METITTDSTSSTSTSTTTTTTATTTAAAPTFHHCNSHWWQVAAASTMGMMATNKDHTQSATVDLGHRIDAPQLVEELWPGFCQSLLGWLG